jgi:ATP-dependent Clp protease ATP-binding subunit ClpX
MPGFVRPDVFMDALSGLVGQDELKIKLASVFSQYTLYLNDEEAGRPLVLVAGRSGTGKTMAVERCIEMANLPYSIASSASISPPSYRGKTMLDVFVQHWLDWKHDYGVVFLDEIDKWCAAAIGRDAESLSMGIRSQAELLKYVEKDQISFVDEAKDIEVLTDVKFSTKRILFVLAGAFTGIERVIKQRLHNSYLPEDEIMQHAIPADYKKYGLLAELCDRVETYAWTNPLKVGDIIKILIDQERPKWVRRFQQIGCELDLQDGALGACAQNAYEQHEAARVAKAMLRRAMDDIYVQVAQRNLTHISVDAGTVRSGTVEN